MEAPEGGRYDPKDNRYPNIQYSISNTERPDQVTRDQRAFPAPGQYNQPDTVGVDAPKYTIGLKHIDREGDNFPEPGRYDPNGELKYHRSPLGIINPQGVQATPILTPGPGDYNPAYNLVHSSSPVANLAPGSERPENVSKDQKNYPGPGSYDAKDPNAPISYTIGLQERPNTVSRDQRAFPGPGTYNRQPDLVGKDAPKVRFNQRNKFYSSQWVKSTKPLKVTTSPHQVAMILKIKNMFLWQPSCQCILRTRVFHKPQVLMSTILTILW